MAQGFRRTGSTFSQKASSSSSNKRPQSGPVRKGARVIAPKRASAQTRAKVTTCLTASLNRRAESALINRIGHEETSLKLVKADPSVLKELKLKSKRKSAAETDEAKTEEVKAPASNTLIKKAIDALGNDPVNKKESSEDEVFTEDEAIPMSSDESVDESIDEYEK